MRERCERGRGRGRGRERKESGDSWSLRTRLYGKDWQRKSPSRTRLGELVSRIESWKELRNREKVGADGKITVKKTVLFLEAKRGGSR